VKELTPDEIAEILESLERASIAVEKFAEVIVATVVTFWESLPDEIKELYEDEGDL